MINGCDNSPQRPISGVLWPSNEPEQRFAYRAGAGPEVERIVREIIEENLNEYFNVDFSIERK